MSSSYSSVYGGHGRTALEVLTYTIIMLADKVSFLPIYINRPCRCCGNHNHSLLSFSDTEVNNTLVYSCPVITIGDGSFGADQQLKDDYLKYRACPIRMAEINKFDPDLIELALSNYEAAGDGAYLSPRSLLLYKEEARRACMKRLGSKNDTENLADFEVEEFKGEDLSDPIATIFCDLDGVLVDFEEGIRRIFQKLPNEIPKKTMWSTVAKIPGFYADLPWMKDGKTLWEAIKDFNPTILTAAPKGSWAERQKREWVTRELGEHIPMIVSTKKYEHCPPSIPPAILIDDRVSHCTEWVEAGGIAVVHTSTKETLYSLAKIGILINETSNPSLVTSHFS
jgi:hypothetical protein